jgi:enamine deaminase RidA (YjgF/YER057c/UK114 family)
MPKEIIRPTNVHEPLGYSHAAKVGNTIYTSGQVSKDLENNLVGKDDFPLQFDTAFENLKKVLEASGATMADIVQLSMFVRDIKFLDMDEVAELWFKHLGPDFPPVTGVQAVLQGDYLIEINAKAVIE